MRQIISIVIFSLVCYSFMACHYSKVAEEEQRVVPIENFDKIYVKGSFSILLKQSDEPYLRMRGLAETLESVNVKSDSTTSWLELSRDKFSMSSPDLVIGFTDLNQVRIEGGASVHSDGFLDLKDLEIRVEGGANINLKLKAQTIHLRGEGGVVYDIEGVVNRLESELFGVAYLKASTLETDTAVVRIEGLGVASLKVNKLLKANMQGMGKISYQGDPEVDQSIEGLGKISQD